MIGEDYREVAAAGTTWFLDTFATPFVKWLGNNAKEQVQQKWTEYKAWPQAEQAYRASLLRNYGSLRIFGKPDEVPLTDVFADVYILDKPTALRRFSMDQLMEHGDLRDFGENRRTERTKGVPLAARGDKLYILGKPGAGKTTFLKYLTVQAAKNKLPRIPIFVSLNDWANSPHGRPGQETLLPYIAEQFAICHFPDAEPFIEYLLKETDRAMVLFDGLDEVKQEDEQRRTLTRLLQDFARQYDRCQCLITCRIAASDYTFQGFRDVEVADFTAEQVGQYAQKWFGDQHQKFELFQQELAKDEHKGLAELCNSPLLLSMLCLYFDDAMAFPTRRAELYEEAIDALLRKWDSTREIQRDKIYQDLSPRRKQQLFAAIAAQTFEDNQQFFPQKALENMIVDSLARLPDAPSKDDIPGEEVLKAIEAQHSIFVERAKGIYSFSHLPFQEYFAARYIVENEARGTVAALVNNHLTDRRWRETFLLTASMLDDADQLVMTMRIQINELIGDDPTLVDLLAWADRMTARDDVADESQLAGIRLAYIFLGSTLINAFALTGALALGHSLDKSLGNAVELSVEISFLHAWARPIDSALSSIVSMEVIDTVRNILVAYEKPDTDILLSNFNNAIEDIFDIKDEVAAPVARILSQASSVDLVASLIYSYGPLIGLNCGVLFAWQMASAFTYASWFKGLQYHRTAYANYYTAIVKLGDDANLLDFTASLSSISVPDGRSSQNAWEEFANALQSLLVKERDFDFTRQISNEQVRNLNTYFNANELLVQCLKLAVVSDRHAVMRDLLKPPSSSSGG